MQAVETSHKSIAELVALLKDVKSALRIFIKIGNGVKWLALLAGSISGVVIAFRKWS